MKIEICRHSLIKILAAYPLLWHHLRQNKKSHVIFLVTSLIVQFYLVCSTSFSTQQQSDYINFNLALQQCYFPSCTYIMSIHTLRVHYVHAAANLNSGYSKYAKVARVHYFCTIALRTSRAVVTRAWASRRVDLRERRVDSFSKRVIIFCW